VSDAVDPRACITLQRETSHGLLIASLDPLAAGLRDLTLAGEPFVQSYPELTEAPHFAGRTLLPWPNRVAGGRWTHDGQTLRLPVNDPEHDASLHGLLSSTVYRPGETTPTSVVFETTLSESQGYPFSLDIAIRYALEDEGLRVTHQVTNRSDRFAPFAAGAHPFLRAGHLSVSAMTLSSQVESYLVSDDNLIPVEEVHLRPGDPLNLSDGVALSKVSLDTAFRVSPSAEGITTRLSSPDGAITELWQDSSWGWVQVFLTDSFLTPDGEVWALAVEPMTAPPNAFATGEDLISLAPGEQWSASWGIRGERPSR